MERSISDQTADEAGYWDARLRSPDCTDDDRLRFEEWRRASRAHQESFDQLQLILACLRQNMARADLRALRDAALNARRTGVARARIVAAGLALAGVAALAALWTATPQRAPLNELAGIAPLIGFSKTNVYETGTGQRSISTLQDGSSVELNAQTRINVVLSKDARRVELVYGQALFHVAPDPHRAFIVRAADREITALGTQFDVRLDGSSVRVTLLEGKVKVASEAPLSAAETAQPQASTQDEARISYLSPGQQLVARVSGRISTINTGMKGAAAPAVTPPRAGDTLIRNVDVSKVTGWRNGRIFLEDLPLPDAVAEMNRHSPVQITVQDGELERFHVNGMFRAGEQQAFVTALEEYFPINARPHGDTQIMLSLRR